MLIVFDFDGTLADTFPLFRAAFNDAAHVMDTPLYRKDDEEQIRALEASAVLRFHNIPDAKADQFVQHLRRGMDARKEQAILFPHVIELLTDLLHMKHSLGLISSASEPLARATLGDNLDLFSQVVFDVPLMNKVAALRNAAALSPAGTKLYYIGDEIRDLRASRETQFAFVGVSWGYNTEKSLEQEGCSILMRSPKDLTAFFANLSSA